MLSHVLYTRKPLVGKKRYCCHTCDHKWCVNPQHIFRGDHAANMRDKLKWVASLTPENIEEIKSSAADTAVIAKEFNIAVRDVEAIRPPKLFRRALQNDTTKN